MLFIKILTAAMPQAAAEYAMIVSQRRGGTFGEIQAFISEYFWAIVAGGAALVLLLMVFGPKTRV